MNTEALKLQFITNYSNDISISEMVEIACSSGIKWIQLRMKKSSDEEILNEGKKIREICNKYNAVFIMNDKLDLVDQLNADGVHLGKNDTCVKQAREILGKSKIIGATANTYQDVAKQYKNGADYIGLGPFTTTNTKDNLSPVLGVQTYIDIINACKKEGLDIPIIAIGGIKSKHIKDLAQTGISGVAVSSLIANSAEPKLSAQEIKKQTGIYLK